MIKLKSMKPLSNLILFEAEEKVNKLKNIGLISPDTLQEEPPDIGTVLAVGEGKLLKDGTRIPIEVKVGDRIYFKRYSPDKVELDGKTYYIVPEDKVWAILDKDAKMKIDFNEDRDLMEYASVKLA